MTERKTILIKKYENRRLYDATNSRYVNLDEVAQFVRLGYDVRAVDVATGEDITRLILTQIIADGARTPDSSFPLDVLRQMVIASGQATQEGAIRYFKALTDLYQNTYRAMTPALNPFEFMGMNGEAAENRAASAPGSGANPPKARVSEAPDDVQHLKERVAELERMVSSLAPRGKRPRSAAKSAGRRKK
ncbi:MAG: polyhydroxyalkanoate synthesis regulator DNA-binding domain-containing protein [Acidobacteriota bacterium]